MTGGYPVPAAPVRVRETVRRSRFRTDLARASTVAEARAFVARVREEDPGATHHCWAYLVGPPGSTARVGCSDDGEPQGTAGQPMLSALLHSGVGDVVAVCTRHYGGVKLGTGGLARAYAGGVKQALATLATERKVVRVPVGVDLDYRDADPVRRVVEELDARIADERYGARVTFACAVPASHVKAFVRRVADATNGRAEVRADPVPRDDGAGA